MLTQYSEDSMPRATPVAKAVLEDTRRRQILEAAARVFAQRGFDRATVTEIAKAAHLAEGSLYNYFRSKEELLIHIPRQLASRPQLLNQLDAPADLAGVEQTLLFESRRAVDRMRAHAPFLKVFLSALPYLSPRARAQYMQLIPAHAVMLERFLCEGMRRGRFRRNLTPAIAARALPGMLMFFVLLQEVMLGRPLTKYGYDAIVQELVSVFLYGVVSRSSRPSRKAYRSVVRRER